MNVRLVTAVAAIVFGVVYGLMTRHSEPNASRAAATTQTPASTSTTPRPRAGAPDAVAVAPQPAAQPPRTPASRRLSSREINQQDRPSSTQRRREQRTARERSLLAHLPLSSHGVTIDVGGLASDHRTTVLTLRSARGEKAARREYRRMLARYHDTGGHYAVQVLP